MRAEILVPRPIVKGEREIAREKYKKPGWCQQRDLDPQPPAQCQVFCLNYVGIGGRGLPRPYQDHKPTTPVPNRRKGPSPGWPRNDTGNGNRTHNLPRKRGRSAIEPCQCIVGGEADTPPCSRGQQNMMFLGYSSVRARMRNSPPGIWMIPKNGQAPGRSRKSWSLELTAGIEPATFCLRNNCSAD